MKKRAEDQKHRPICGLNLLYIRPGYRGGTVRYAYRLFREFLKQNDFEWRVYVREGVELPSEFKQPNVKLKVIPVWGGIFGRVMYEQMLLPLRVQKDRAELLFSPGFVTPLWGSFKKVVTIHDLYYHLYPRFVRFWQRQYWRVFIPLSLRAADHVITVSKTTRRDLTARFPGSQLKSRSIPLGIAGDDNQKLEKDKIKSSPYCLVVGNLTPNKNIGLVVDAITKLNREGVNCELKIVGRDLEGELRKHLATTKCDKETIELLTGIDDEELWRLYRGAACTIQASNYEGFGLPVLEAMAQGSPVITSDADALLEVAGDAALTFKRGSIDELCRAIKRILNDDGLKEQLRRKGLKNIKLYSWTQTATETREVFWKLLSESKRTESALDFWRKRTRGNEAQTE